ncbi:uncharacterized protein LOC134714347 [Mytilus trossulus]|uniref:uncharacterized protein LOC134714347 n=1 Tax=Mytilus trossulus TaxID=6551 RepID=UPI0030074C8B
MALSKSFQKGQVPMLCQMCEESNEIKWKCIQCDFLLCTKCQKLHQKVKSTDQHIIIEIKDIPLHQQQSKDKLDLSNIQCGIHSEHNCFLFCQSCEVVVCPLCITKIHNKHTMVELAEGYQLTLKSMKTFNSEIEEEIDQNEEVLSELGILKSSEDRKYELEKQNILNREKILKDEVEKHTNKLLKELDQRKEILMQSVNNARNRSQKINKDLDLRRKNLNHALNSNIANQVFNIYSEEKTSRQQRIVPASPKFKKLPKFVPGKNIVQDFYVGELKESDDDQKIFEFKVIKQYKTEFEMVNNLVCFDDRSIFISGYPSDLLLSTKESNLTILSGSTSKVNPTKFSVNPLITLGVHVTSDHKILVGVRENQPKTFPVNGPRQVIMMSMDGKKEKVYHTDNKGKLIFTVPFRITTDNDNNIYVIDILDEEYRGRIVALDKTNIVRWIYTGNPDINKKQTMKPGDLVATKSDNIIVTDDHHHMIYILNTIGQCIHYLNTKDQLGIHIPYSLDIDSTGTLYIGCCTYESEPNEAKIYTVSGF